MSTTVLPPPTDSAAFSGIRLGTAVALAIWFVLVVSLGAAGAFVGRPGAPPVGIAMGVTLPLLVFFTCLRFSAAFRDFIFSLDLRLIAGMQACRWAGLGFIFLPD